MAVPTEQFRITYAGAGSPGPFAIPFPFLETAHIFVAVSADGVEAAVDVSQSTYTVTRLSDGSGGSLILNAPLSAPATITIRRQLPLTQPSVFQAAGPFPAKAAEQALDRLCMQAQQIAAGEDSGGGGLFGNGTLTWPAATDRGAVKPQLVGQLGVEISTQTVWIARSTAPGDWVVYGSVGAINGLLKANGSGVLSVAVPGVDYQTPLIHVNHQTGTTYTIGTDPFDLFGGMIVGTNTSPQTYTLPNSAPAGASCAVKQGGTQQITFAVQSGGNIDSDQSFTKTLKQKSVVGFVCDDNPDGVSANWTMTGSAA